MSASKCYRILSPIMFDPEDGSTEVWEAFKKSADIYETPFLLWLSGEDVGTMDPWLLPREFGEVSWEFLREFFYLDMGHNPELRDSFQENLDLTESDRVFLKDLSQRMWAGDKPQAFKFTFKDYLQVMALCKRWAIKTGQLESYDFHLVWSQEDVDRHVQDQQE